MFGRSIEFEDVGMAVFLSVAPKRKCLRLWIYIEAGNGCVVLRSVCGSHVWMQSICEMGAGESATATNVCDGERIALVSLVVGTSLIS
jgi:hypothetical protein